MHFAHFDSCFVIKTWMVDGIDSLHCFTSTLFIVFQSPEPWSRPWYCGNDKQNGWIFWWKRNLQQLLFVVLVSIPVRSCLLNCCFHAATSSHGTVLPVTQLTTWNSAASKTNSANAQTLKKFGRLQYDYVFVFCVKTLTCWHAEVRTHIKLPHIWSDNCKQKGFWLM